ncbi:MAG: glycerophosphodiester phosphodiesterase [Bacteroidota bacterium]|nr:glycerophosphodiester phosphodiesterase [Bacteroidota bacterium]
MSIPDNTFLHPRLPEVHGHRGCRGLRPENTLPAFLHALALGVDVLELDVVISADRQVVVSHEPWLNPTICRGPAGESLTPDAAPLHNLYRMPYARIQQCDCGLPHPGFPRQQSQPAPKPLLRVVLAATQAYAASQPGRRSPGYSIEIKSLPEGDSIYHPAPAEFFRLVLAEIDQAGVGEQSTILSFDPRVLRQAHLVRPALRTCLLVEPEQEWLPNLHRLGFVPTSFGPNHSTVTAAAVAALRTQYPGLRLVPWTVNEPADFIRLIELGIEGITTDYPDRLIAQLHRPERV